MSFEDDIVFGESVRGMQDAHVGSYSEIGAAQKLAQLRGAIGQLSGQHFARHAPTSKVMRSPYKDSTQISISCSGTFTPQNWNASALPTISGASRVYKSFKPAKAILTESILVVYQNSSGTRRTKAANVTDAADLLLTAAFSGADNCFPNAPNESNGIHGPALANVAYGNGISWPTINGGIDMSVTFAIDQTVLFFIDPPAGFTDEDIISVKVVARLALMGPSLR
jgi:hypothetical protein